MTLTPPNFYLPDQYSFQATNCCDRKLEQHLPLSYHPTCWLLYGSIVFEQIIFQIYFSICPDYKAPRAKMCLIVLL